MSVKEREVTVSWGRGCF